MSERPLPSFLEPLVDLVDDSSIVIVFGQGVCAIRVTFRHTREPGGNPLLSCVGKTAEHDVNTFIPQELWMRGISLAYAVLRDRERRSASTPPPPPRQADLFA